MTAGERVLAIVGPTAVGKTAASLEVAERLGAEIVSVDSMQIYRGMDIGTDKASREVRARVPHHLIDIKEPHETVTVEEFQTLARAAIDEVTARGKVPLLVGGSGLYLRAVVDDLRFPPRDRYVRAALEEEAESLGSSQLHKRLQDLDPAAAAKVEPGNVRRTIRALEVIEITGDLFSAQDAWDRYESVYDLRVVGLQRPRPELYERIALRVRSMFSRGLVGEVLGLAPRLGRTAKQAVGYRQVLECPDAPRGALETAVVAATKRFARRQEAWFRADPRLEWLDAPTPLPRLLEMFE